MSDNVRSLIESGECETVEFKTSFGNDCIQTLSAFANCGGGTVLVGISDSKSVIGVPTNPETLQNWVNTIKQATSPSLIPDVRTETVDGKTVVLLHVDEFPVKPVACRDRYFRRVANSNHRLSLTDIANLHLQSLQLSWDSYPDAKASYLTRDIEKYGSGFVRIREEITKYPTMRFQYEENGEGFSARLHYMEQRITTTQETTQETTPGDVQRAILELLRSKPKLTRRELTVILGKGDATIKEHIAKLKERGLLERVGSTKGGAWKVKKLKTEKGDSR